MKQLLLIICLIIGLSAFQKPRSPFNQLPKGSIIGWGSKAGIPHGWLVCNGANGTPDLIERFPYGTANSADIGQKLGRADHSHTVNGTTQIPNQPMPFNGDESALQKDGGQRVHHTHSFSATTSVEPLIPPATRIIFIMKID